MLQITRFINPVADFAFKKIFCAEPNNDLLIAFLNGVFRGRKQIVDLVSAANVNEIYLDSFYTTF